MKTSLILFAGALVTALLFSSCNGNLRIEKRHYGNGFYTNLFSSGTNDHTKPVEPDIPACTEQLTTEDTATYAVSAEGSPVSATEQTDPAEISISQPIVAAPGSVVQDTIKQSKKQRKVSGSHGPAETQNATDLYRIGLLLIILGLLFCLFVFFPALPFISILRWIFWAGIIVSIVAIVVASEGVGKYTGRDKELEARFRIIRRWAFWAILGGLIARLLLLWTLIVVALYL